MQFTKNPPWLIELFESALAGRDAVRRKMFGSACAFVGGNLACGLFGSDLFLRLSEPDRARLLALPGAEPFDPMGGRPMREYAVVPKSMLEDEEVLRAWVGRALDRAASLPPKRPGKTSRKSPAATQPRAKPGPAARAAAAKPSAAATRPKARPGKPRSRAGKSAQIESAPVRIR